ncbi:MAG TPA: type VI secretion system baseplate subunit TssG [Polyangia bacterium]|nr:type VI secretion system baseplate subunit TssG [Polyangia bacterium]
MSAPPTPTSRDILKEGNTFALFQAIRILERLGGPRLGREGPAGDEVVRLRPSLSLAFSPADVELIDKALPPKEAPDLPVRWRITTRFLGLYGVTSPLPNYYAEALAQADPESTRVRDFLDLFHHRLLSLLFRAWTRHHYEVEFQTDGSDDLSRRLLAWLGINPRVAELLEVAPVRLLRYAGLLIGRDRPPRALEIMWAELLDVPIRVRGNMGRWIMIPPDQKALLGVQSMLLGEDFVIGNKTFDVSGKFRVVVGPCDYETFESFLPGGAGLQQLHNAVEAALPAPFDYEVEVRLRAECRPPFRLSTPKPNRLGYTAWPGHALPASSEDVTVLVQASAVNRT